MDTIELQQNLLICEPQKNSSAEYTERHSFLVKIFFWSMIIRLLYLLFLLCQPYRMSVSLLEDDMYYEFFGEEYILSATSLFDNDAFNLALTAVGGNKNYHMWFWTVAVITYIFKSTLFVRLLNIVVSSLIPIQIYHLCELVGLDLNKSKLACQLYAFMPYSVIMSCFVFKDILLTFLVMHLCIILFTQRKVFRFNIWVLLQILLLYLVLNDIRRSSFESVCFLCLMVFFFGDSKKKVMKVVLFLASIVSLYLLAQFNMLSAFEEKFDAYSEYNRTNSSISLFRIDSIGQMYKIPGMFCFAILQPMLSPSILKTNSNLLILAILNLSTVPVMFWNFISLFHKKSMIVIFSILLIIVSSFLTLGTFRHYFSVLPFVYINCAIAVKSASQSERFCVVSGSVFVTFSLLVYTFFL